MLILKHRSVLLASSSFHIQRHHHVHRHTLVWICLYFKLSIYFTAGLLYHVSRLLHLNLPSTEKFAKKICPLLLYSTLYYEIVSSVFHSDATAVMCISLSLSLIPQITVSKVASGFLIYSSTFLLNISKSLASCKGTNWHTTMALMYLLIMSTLKIYF